MPKTILKKLADGSVPLKPDELLAELTQLGILYSTIRHPPLRTVEEAKKHRPIASGAHSKNLFVRNKKGKMWLLTLQESQVVDLKHTAKNVGAGNFTFGRPERLMAYLGIIPGAVSPFSLINDRSHQVQFVLDQTLTTFETLHFHPLDNRQTTTIQTSDLFSFLAHINHLPTILDFNSL